MVYRFFSFLFIVALGLAVSGCFDSNERLEVMSFNVRYDNPGDSLNRWGNRLPLIETYLKTESPDIIGMQEVLVHQLHDLEGILPGYKYTGVGRDDGIEKGEFCPVFYKSDAFELMAKSHFWLSETPDIPGSKSWGAHLPRVVTWLKLKNLKTGHIFFFFNTHLSHVSEDSRMKGVALLMWKMQEIAGNAPVVLTGDFNTTRDTQTYENIVGKYEGFYSLWDAEMIASGRTTGGAISYNGFNEENKGTRVDYVFVNGYFDVLRHKVDEFKSGDIFISDHYPVSAIIKFSTQLRKKDGQPRLPVTPPTRSRMGSDPGDGLLMNLRSMSF
jgi:endonuclease/exonuclease/phosphatase family metal-dependent hydrolase